MKKSGTSISENRLLTKAKDGLEISVFLRANAGDRVKGQGILMLCGEITNLERFHFTASDTSLTINSDHSLNITGVRYTCSVSGV